ncbi:bile acid:sodium symporter family protein [Thiomicrorhabdus sediminis]|uniref:Bile acid:sodium symporter family protein n=1 Tax=Thiomicrorhabdus sediminis TaxID=2580412 RepID=A0A4P9K438_9GAMM|nr:bile acid:sodium symporter family protein [Thiomicrorhabdus sediminis]QCU89672.1 bile acid:sodium symporter family protein [Thiomicrorhabdus sediminis]
MSPDLLTKVILPAALFLIMFGLGLSLRLQNFKDVFKAPKAMAIGLTGQMILLPIVAFIIALAFQLPPEIAVGLMIIALAPGGATSNMFTYLSKGDVSLSISLTAVVSVITPFTIPLIAALSMDYFMGNATEFSLPVLKTMVQLMVITIIPVALGMFVLSRWESVAKKIETVIKWFSVFFLALIVLLIVAKNRDNMLDFFAQAGLATLVLNISVLMLGYQLAKLSRLNGEQSIAIGFEVGLQNGTLALFVAGTLIGSEVMMIPAVTYSLIMFVTGLLFGYWINKRVNSMLTKQA